MVEFIQQMGRPGRAHQPSAALIYPYAITLVDIEQKEREAYIAVAAAAAAIARGKKEGSGGEGEARVQKKKTKTKTTGLPSGSSGEIDAEIGATVDTDVVEDYEQMEKAVDMAGAEEVEGNEEMEGEEAGKEHEEEAGDEEGIEEEEKTEENSPEGEEGGDGEGAVKKSSTKPQKKKKTTKKPAANHLPKNALQFYTRRERVASEGTEYCYRQMLLEDILGVNENISLIRCCNGGGKCQNYSAAEALIEALNLPADALQCTCSLGTYNYINQLSNRYLFQ